MYFWNYWALFETINISLSNLYANLQAHKALRNFVRNYCIGFSRTTILNISIIWMVLGKLTQLVWTCALFVQSVPHHLIAVAKNRLILFVAMIVLDLNTNWGTAVPNCVAHNIDQTAYYCVLRTHKFMTLTTSFNINWIARIILQSAVYNISSIHLLTAGNDFF